MNELVYGELNLQPGKQVSAERWRMEVQPESMPALETELLFVHRHHVLAGSEQLYKQLQQTAVWPTIPAVSSQKVRHIPNWFVMSWTPIGRQRIMKELLAAVSLHH